MWAAQGIYEEYRKIINRERAAAPGQDVFITLEDLQKHLALSDKDFKGMLEDIKPSFLYLVRLATAPAAYRGRRYRIFGQEYVFFAITRYKQSSEK